jgi:hypothetical protein
MAMRGFVRRPSASMVVACGALLLSLTGTGLADVAALGKNTVGTPQLRTGAVTAPKMRSGAVTTAKLRNNAVTLVKLAPNARIAGPSGPEGPAGPPGPPGAPANLTDGSISTTKLADAAVTSTKLANGSVTAGKLASFFVRTVTVNIGIASFGGVNAPCGSGGRIVSGGASWDPIVATNADAKNLHIVRSYPGDDSSRWSVTAYNGTGGVRKLVVYLLCLKNA